MRSYLYLAGLALGVGLLALSGYLPRRAGAISGASDKVTDQGSGTALEMRYTDFEEEQPFISDHPTRSRRQDTANAKPAPPPQGDTAEPEPDQSPAGDEDEQPLADHPQPVADAGVDRILWLGTDEVPLDGSGSTGDALTYAWRQVAGPYDLTIKKASAAKTVATGFPLDGWTDWDDGFYEFELMVTDAYGQQTGTSVRHVVKSAPDLHIKPKPKREFALRDGYLLAHFEVWTTNRADYAETFRLSYSSELFIERVGGDADYEIALSDAEDAYVYQVVVYYREGQPTSWLELFVDTPERVPAVVQLGVNWE